MTSRSLRPQVVVAELHIRFEPGTPTATLTCHRCPMPPYTVRGRQAVSDYVRSRPLHEHRVNCPANTALMGRAA